MSEKSFCVTCGVVRYAAAWRRDCSVSRLPSVMIFSATGRAAFARVSVVVMRPCSRRFVTRLRSVARRCHGLRPSFDPDLRCRISPVSFLPPWHLPAPQSFGDANFYVEILRASIPDAFRSTRLVKQIDRTYRPALSSIAVGGAVWLGGGGPIM